VLPCDCGAITTGAAEILPQQTRVGAAPADLIPWSASRLPRPGGFMTALLTLLRG